MAFKTCQDIENLNVIEQLLINNIVEAIQRVPLQLQQHQVEHFSKAAPAYGEKVAKGLKAA